MTEPAESAFSAATETPEEVAAEDASDAQLRAWAKENGLEGVPATGRLSAVWRETVILAMTKALDPKDEGTAQATPDTDSPGASDTSTSTTEETETEKPAEVKLEKPLAAPAKIQPEFDNPSGEYRSVFYAPDTWISSQTFTA